MDRFKTFLVEGKGEYYRQRNRAVQPQVPHIPLLDYMRKDGKDVRFNSHEERLDALLSDKPVYADSPDHVEMHDIINKMEEKEYEFGTQSKYKRGTKVYAMAEKFTPGYAQIARMLNNGGSARDIEGFMNSKHVSDDDSVKLTRGSIGVYIANVKRAIDTYQRVELKRESPRRITMGTVTTSKPENPYPGGFSLMAVLTHPHHREELAGISNEEFYRKHIERHVGTPHSSLDADQKKLLNIRFAQARQDVGIANDDKAKERRKEAFKSAIQRRWDRE